MVGCYRNDGAIEQQPLIEHMGLERIVGRIEARDECPQADRDRHRCRRILPPIHIVRGVRTASRYMLTKFC